MTIPALRIEVNGELVAVAGAEELSLLTGTVGFGAGEGKTLNGAEVMFSVMGLAVNCPQPKQLTWAKNVKLRTGDRVSFQFVEVEVPSPPDQTLRSPSSSELAAEAARGKSKPARRPK
jgi:hypothetical protein